MKILNFPNFTKNNPIAKNNFAKNPISFKNNISQRDTFEFHRATQNPENIEINSQEDLDKVKKEIDRIKDEIEQLQNLERYQKYLTDKGLKLKWNILSQYINSTEEYFDLIDQCTHNNLNKSEQYLQYIFYRLAEIPPKNTGTSDKILNKLIVFTKEYFAQCAKKQQPATPQGLDEHIKKGCKKEADKIKLSNEDKKIENHITAFQEQLKRLEKKYYLYLDESFKDISPEAKKILAKTRCFLDMYKDKKIEVIDEDIKKVINLIPEIKIYHKCLMDITSPITQKAIADYRAGHLVPASELANKYGINIKTFQSACSCIILDENRRAKQTMIDLRDKKMQQAIKNVLLTHPKKSKYYLSGFGTGENITRSIPVKYLASLGFGTEKVLIKLIDAKKIQGETIKTENGNEYNVIIDSTKIIQENPTAKTLFQLRDKTPHIYSSKDLRKDLGLTQKEFEQALLDEELEIIPEYITLYDKEQRYIDISTPKNKHFYLKRKIELEIKNSLLQKEKEERINNMSYNRRIHALRSKLAWMFMPMTKTISSEIAKQDGYLCSLLAKADDPEAELTSNEEKTIKSYYKEVWLTAGTEEQKAAYKKANEILRTFKEQGLEAVDKEYLPIFEMYGFTLN